ncbi:MAG: NADH-quinone oxidoreductase subunit NuoH [Planctomycetia bacterium]|nr:NADH-quinone oxidoreductase subunit NuoH [Planctomycetia bacterium]
MWELLTHPWTIRGIVALLVLLIVPGICAYLIFLERKIAAWTQDRIGPNRVGPWGLLQSIADGLKFLLKEQIVPSYVNKVLYFVAPGIGVGCALLGLAVVPFGATSLNTADPQQWIIAPRVDIGILYVLAIGSLTVYAIILGGWASNNKYSFIGSLRSSAQVISYEIPLGMSILGIVLLVGSLNLEKIIDYQLHHGWFFLYQPLAFLIFFTSSLAENNRMPFDLPETEQELVGGFHTEYSAMKFAMFFLGEYSHMITISLLCSVLFLGGWHFPGITSVLGPGEFETWGGAIIKFLVLFTKMVLFIVIIMLIRWTIPRFRYDQLMGLAWKVLIPLSLGNLFFAMVVRHFNWSAWLLLPVNILLFLIPGAISIWRQNRQELELQHGVSVA